MLKLFGKLLWVYLVFGKKFESTFYAFGQIFIAVDSKILMNNVAIWSHCQWCVDNKILPTYLPTYKLFYNPHSHPSGLYGVANARVPHLSIIQTFICKRKYLSLFIT